MRCSPPSFRHSTNREGREPDREQDVHGDHAEGDGRRLPARGERDEYVEYSEAHLAIGEQREDVHRSKGHGEAGKEPVSPQQASGRDEPPPELGADEKTPRHRAQQEPQRHAPARARGVPGRFAHDRTNDSGTARVRPVVACRWPSAVTTTACARPISDASRRSPASSAVPTASAHQQSAATMVAPRGPWLGDPVLGSAM